MRYRRTAADSVRVMRPDGRGGRRLRLSDAELLVPRPWAASGSRFLVSTSKAVFAVDPVSGKSTKLRVRKLYAEAGYSFALSPDRRRLLFAHKLGAGGVDVLGLRQRANTAGCLGISRRCDLAQRWEAHRLRTGRAGRTAGFGSSTLTAAARGASPYVHQICSRPLSE